MQMRKMCCRMFYQFIGNPQPVDQVTAWLFTVARNKIIDRQRKHQPEALDENISDDDTEETYGWNELLFNASDNPEQEYLRNMFWEELNVALQELPEEQRSVFIQHELEGVSFKTLSEQTGETVNTSSAANDMQCYTCVNDCVYWKTNYLIIKILHDALRKT